MKNKDDTKYHCMDGFITRIPKSIPKRKSVPSDEGPSKAKQRATQLFLDLGQKDFARRRQCSSCSMLYMEGDVDDEKDHRTFCESVRRGVCIKNAHKFKVISTFRLDSLGEAKVIEVVKSQWESPSVKAVIKMAMEELGSNLSYLQEVESRCFMLILPSSRAAGCIFVEQVWYASLRPNPLGLLVEQVSAKKLSRMEATSAASEVLVPQVDSAPTIAKSADNTGPASPGRPGVSAEDRSEIPPPAREMEPETRVDEVDVFLGVRQIWVDSQLRGRGLARRLVDAARKVFWFGAIVPLHKLAFSQPTAMGQHFALSYTQESHLLVYA